MPDALQVDFETDNLREILQGLEGIERGFQRAGRAAKSAGGTPQIRQGIRTDALRDDLAFRNAARLDRENLRTRALAARTQVAELRAKRQAERMEKKPSSLSSRLNTLVRSTRFGAEGVEPLVGRSLDLFAPELGEAAGPVGLLAVGAMEAVKGLRAFTEDAKRSALELSRNRYSLGGNIGTARQFQALSGPMGGMDLGAAAANLAGTSIGSASGLQISALMQLGLKGPDLTPEYAPGASDRGTRLKHLLNNLRSSKMSKDKLRQLLIQAGQDPDLLAVKDIPSDQTYQDLLAQGDAAGRAQGQNVGDAANLATSQENLKSAKDRALAPAQKLGLRAGTAINRAASQSLNDAADHDFYQQRGAGEGPVYGPVFASASPRAKQAYEHYQQMQKHTEALNRHASVMQKHAEALVRVPGEYGTVNRAGALPSGLPAGVYDRAAKARRSLALSMF